MAGRLFLFSCRIYIWWCPLWNYMGRGLWKGFRGRWTKRTRYRWWFFAP